MNALHHRVPQSPRHKSRPRVQVLCAALLCALLSSAAQAQKRVALVIGIDKYDNLGPSAQLRKARSDAAAVARVLRDL